MSGRQGMTVHGFLLAGLGVLALGLGGCTAVSGVPAPKVDTTVGPRPAEPPPLDSDLSTLPTDATPVARMPIPPDAFLTRPLQPSRPLPSLRIDGVSYDGEPIGLVLQGLLEGTGYSIVVEDQKVLSRTVTAVDLAGDVSDVVNTVCRAAGLYCQVGERRVLVQEKGTFIVNLPPLFDDKGVESLKQSIEALVGQGGGNTEKKAVVLDPSGSQLLYRASQQEAALVDQYLEQWRHGKATIIYSFFIWEVQLVSNNTSGIKWENFRIGNGGSVTGLVTGGTTLATAGATFGTVFSGNISGTVLAQFLGSQGYVKRSTSPTLSLTSGGSHKTFLGGSQWFVKTVGALTNGQTNTNGGTGVSTPVTANGLVNNTVQTEKLDRGLTVELKGQWYGGLIYTKLAMKMRDIRKIDSFDSGQGKVQLPDTDERELNADSAFRPGDSLLLSGARNQRADYRVEGVTVPGRIGTDVPTGSAHTQEDTELVVLMRPRVVVYEPVAASSPDIKTPPLGQGSNNGGPGAAPGVRS